MTATRPDTALLLSRFLGVGGLVSVLILTLIDRGATRAYATPWIYLFWFAQVAPLLALSLRALPSSLPLQLPGRSWCILIAVSATAVVLSAILSPYRGPSLLAALTPLAGLAAFLLIHDAAQTLTERSRDIMLRWISVGCLAILVVSLGRWAIGVLGSGAYRHMGALLSYRNDFPLGHTNYTAGLALLIIPWLGYQAWLRSGVARAGWTSATLLAVAMLFTSGSRGGLIGAAALGLLSVMNARVNRRTVVLLSLLAVTIVAALAYAHPRTRAMIAGYRQPTAERNLSDVQRAAMAMAGWQMGRDRPLLGWGPGTTPLVYPRYRAKLDGGVENALQLHSTPIQLWADFGVIGVTCLLVFALLVGHERRPGFTRSRRSRSEPPLVSSREVPHGGTKAATISDGVPPLGIETRNDNGSSQPLSTPAFLSLAGYAAFALTDSQLDVPIFMLAVATCAALIAGRTTRIAQQVGRTLRVSWDPTRLGGDASPYHASPYHWLVSLPALSVLLIVGVLGHRERAPELNVRALSVGNDPAHATDAIELLKQSLALNVDQEIAHFNLGWLLVVRDPAAAEQHFKTAAHLVPDKGGVYFGLALARLNQGSGNAGRVVHALALECLNDPQFLISPWWKQPDIGALRGSTVTEVHRLANIMSERFAATKDARKRDADYVPILADWLDGGRSIGEMLRVSYNPARVTYFAARPSVPEWKTADVRAYRRERPGYPVLMRDLDLPTPVDLFDVQENSLATTELAGLFPRKGWLPAPLLIELLDGEAAK